MLLVLLATFLIGFAKAGVPGLGMLIGPLAILGVSDAPWVNGYLLPLLIVGDVFCGWRYFGQWDRRIVASMAAGAALGVLATSPLLDWLGDRTVLYNRTMGGLAVLFGTWQLLLELRHKAAEGELPPPSRSPWLGAAAGALTAVTSTIAHQGGLVSNLYLASLRMSKERFIATATGAYFLINTFKVPAYVDNGLINPETLRYGAFCWPLVILGGVAGAAFVKRVSAQQFTKLILVLTLASGVKLLFWPGH